MIISSEQINEALKDGANAVAYNINNATNKFVYVYEHLMNKSICSTCPAILYQAYLDFKKKSNSLFLNQFRRYKMKPDTMIDTHCFTDIPQGHFTDFNLSDDVAEKLLNKGLYEDIIFETEHFQNQKKVVETENLQNQKLVETTNNLSTKNKTKIGKSKSKTKQRNKPRRPSTSC